MLLRIVGHRALCVLLVLRLQRRRGLGAVLLERVGEADGRICARATTKVAPAGVEEREADEDGEEDERGDDRGDQGLEIDLEEAADFLGDQGPESEPVDGADRLGNGEPGLRQERVGELAGHGAGKCALS